MNEWEWQLLEDKAPIDSVTFGGVAYQKGDRVRLRPRKGGDIFDLALAGQFAIIEAIEQDYESKLHVAVILENDPGKDLGMLRQPGHRFFFTAEEIEPAPIAEDERAVEQPKILVAGIGNIFLGDDGFGVEVAQRVSRERFPDNVHVRDFGIRGYDLAYALLDGYDTTILVDATARGEAAGTLYVIEIDGNEAEGQDAPPIALDAHTMNPVSVIRMARAMGPISERILLVACEPATLGGDDGRMGLSDPVAAAIDAATELVKKLINDAVAEGSRRDPR